MRLVALLFVLVLSACATTARAEEQAPNAIAACLATSEPEARRICIGIVSRPCMDEPAGVSTFGMIDCFARERELWSAESSRLVALLRGRESETQIAQLDAMLAAHEPWMRARCAYSASFYEGGSMTRILGAACARDTSAELTLDLLRRFDEG